jgi:hypothetical protein
MIKKGNETACKVFFFGGGGHKNKGLHGVGVGLIRQTNLKESVRCSEMD